MFLFYLLHNGGIAAKKLLSQLLVLVFVVSISPLNLAIAAVTNRSEEVANLITAKLDDVDDLSQLSIADFELDADTPSNLYLRLYEQKISNIEELALKNTSLISGYNYFTVRDVVLQDSVDLLDGPIEAKQAQAAQINAIYTDELVLAQTSTDLLLNTYFFDIYANGDEGDAEFDLVSDLQTIHDLMFVGRPPTYLANNPNTSKKDLFNVSLDNALTIGRSAAGPSGIVSTETAPAETQTSGQLCPADPELLALLTDRRTANAALSSETTETAVPIAKYTPRPLSEFLQPVPFKCEPGVFFCVDIEKIYERTQNYFPGDEDCVACQISKINETMEKELLPKNLYPGKVTGLFGETAECTESFLRLPLGLNITLEGKPVISDKNRALEELTGKKPADSEPKKQPADNITPSIAITKSNPYNQTQLEIAARADKITNNINAVLLANASAKTGSDKVTQYQGFAQNIKPKMQEFNSYLEKFQLQMLQLSQTVNDFATKPLCND